MRKTLIIVLVVVVVAALILSPWILSALRTRRIEAFVSEADRASLRFVLQGESGRTDLPAVNLTAKTDIQAFVGDLELEAKEPCQCAPHVHLIRFWQGRKSIEVSACSHCFNVIDRKHVLTRTKVTRFNMPDSLWRRISEFKESARELEQPGREHAPAATGEDAAGGRTGSELE